VRFNSGQVEGRYRHHDIALVEQPALAAGQTQALNHVAVGYPTFEAWQRQGEYRSTSCRAPPGKTTSMPL
jgi:hypothetical protein